MKTVHILVKGKVQGVFYRASAKEVAVKMALKGWVKNTLGGDVELMVTGKEESIKSFVAWCRQGPKRARVEEVIVEERDIEMFNGFEILR